MHLGMGQVEHAADHVAELVVQSATGCEGLAGEPGARERGGARVGVARAAQGGADAAREQPEALLGGDVGERRRARSPERLDAVRDGVHPARRSDVRGKVVGQLGIEDDEARRYDVGPAGRLASVPGHAPRPRQLGARVGRRHRGDREPFRQRDGLGEPDGGPAADRDQAVRAELGRRDPGGFGALGGHVDAHADDLVPVTDGREQLVGVLGLRTADDHERAPELEAGELLRQVGERAGAENDAPCERLVHDDHGDSIPACRRDRGRTDRALLEAPPARAEALRLRS